MPITSVRCPVLDACVSRVVDLEGQTISIICSHYEEPTGLCRVQKRMFDGGRLSELLGLVEAHVLDSRATQCVLRPYP